MNRRAAGRNVSDRRRGLTLIEMMIVLSIILILLGAAIPIYSHSIRRAREANLRRNLETLNQAIYQYAMDKQKAPESLDDLHAAGYIDKVPDDIDGQPIPGTCRWMNRVGGSNHVAGHKDRGRWWHHRRPQWF